MSSVIEVENLGKKYIITHQGEASYTALRDVITDGAKKIIKRRGLIPKKEDFWALRGVSFVVNKGDKLGIIGRNGAGKTTILKILSRVTIPSEGIVKIKGRISSLLEVGTGFHPELTGRENIFFNGAILGMTRVEIKRKFDEIVEFAEIEKFLDTPVKRYSSGMYVRLAFAVAAHLDSEILLIDEVLAVGDTQFQKKCLGKMDDVSNKEGRTILFVSHNMATIKNLCETGFLISKGHLQFEGSIDEVISKYEYDNPLAASKWENPANIGDAEYFDISAITLLDKKKIPKKEFFNSETIYVKMDLLVNKIHSQMKIQFDLIRYGEIVFSYPIFLAQNSDISEGKHSVYCEIPAFLLNEGNYFITADVSLHCIQGYSRYDHVLNIDIKRDEIDSLPHLENVPGYIFPLLKWYIED